MINSTHISFDFALTNWQRVREVIDGEDSVKAAGERYLPRVSAQTDDEYNSYRQRASFFNATARTAEGYLGLIFRRPPFIKLPESSSSSKSLPLSADPTIQQFNGSTSAFPASSIEIRNSKFENVNEVVSPSPDSTLQQFNGSTAAPFSPIEIQKSKFKNPLQARLEQFVANTDLHGTPFAAYAKTIANEVLTVGRAGSLMDFESGAENRPYIARYPAEQILNWCVERINGRDVPTVISLRETASRFGFQPASAGLPGDPNPFATDTVDQVRVLRLVPSNTLGTIQQPPGRSTPVAHSSHSYVCEIWQEIPSKNHRDKPKWHLITSIIPSRLGIALPFIPFVFHGPRHSRPDIDKSPLQDIIAINLDHYRLDADYKHGLHYTALPTAWISGFERSSNHKIGSSTAWVTEQTGATAGFLEFHGHGLTSFERAMDRAERQMAVLGSRLLEDQKKVGETAQAIELRQSGENSILSSIATSLSDSLTQVLRWAYWWLSTADSLAAISDNQALVRLNTDFSTKGLASDELHEALRALIETQFKK